jgi:predicted Zn-ribbon and HTH transcriptional regulator
MQCPHCGLVVRGYPEVFTSAIRCPDCKVEATFRPEKQVTAPKPAEAPAPDSKVAAPATPDAKKSTESGKIHMQCPHCGLVVRGYAEVFAQPIRCPDCKVETTFKPEKQETGSKKEKSASRWKSWPFSLKRKGQ